MFENRSAPTPPELLALLDVDLTLEPMDITLEPLALDAFEICPLWPPESPTSDATGRGAATVPPRGKNEPERN